MIIIHNNDVYWQVSRLVWDNMTHTHPGEGPEHPPTIRELYPELSEEELREAEDKLERYILLVLRIYERDALGKSSRPASKTEKSEPEQQSLF